MVSYVSPGTPGAKAGILAGDRILAMQNQIITPKDKVMPLRQLLRAAPGTTIQMQLERNGNSFPVTFQLEELLPAKVSSKYN